MPDRRAGTRDAVDPVDPSAQTEADRPLRRDAQENRRRVLEAAAQVFAVHGLDAPVEEIAQAAGVGMGTLYRRFPTKEALIDQLVNDFFDTVLAAGRQALEATDGTGFESFVRQTVLLQASHRGCISRLWRDAVPERVVAEVRRLLAELLERAKSSGRIRSDCSTTDVMVLFWAARGIIEAGGEAAPQACNRHLDIVLAGLRCDAAPTVR